MTTPPEPAPDLGLFDAIVNLCKRRGFVFPSAEIYGGIRSTYDYGPLGALMLRNIKDAWWRAMIQERDDVVPIDAAILTNPKVWEASGHLATFTDPLVDCRKCNERWRADQIEDTCPELRVDRPHRSSAVQLDVQDLRRAGRGRGLGRLPAARDRAGHVRQLRSTSMTTMRLKPPFGIAQIGRSFRNEITPGQLRVPHPRVRADGARVLRASRRQRRRWFEYWCEERLAWYQRYGIAREKLRLRPHDPEELSHYSSGTADVEFVFPWGWGELEGIANRTDFDLKAHPEHSGERLEYFDQATGERYIPHVIEPAAGATRAMMAFLLAAYDEDEVGGETTQPCSASTPARALTRSRCSRSRRRSTLTPLRPEVARALCSEFMCEYDDTQSIGRRYRRQDEIGTPLLRDGRLRQPRDNAVTVRDRDTTEQVRIPIDEVVSQLSWATGHLKPATVPSG